MLRRVQATGLRTAILSNAPTSMAVAVRAADWSSGFEHRFFSCDLGAAKPEAAVYRVVEEAFDGAPLVFLDDRANNVEGALARGWRAHLWTGAAAAQEFLNSVGVPLDAV